MGEVPIVIVDVQRMGPATGGATTVGQGDIQFLRWGTSGGYPVIVLSPTSVAECYSLTCKAFDLAERFRVPVFPGDRQGNRPDLIHGGSKWNLSQYLFAKEKYVSEEGEFIPYQVNNAYEVPGMSPYGGAHLLRFTTSTMTNMGS